MPADKVTYQLLKDQGLCPRCKAVPEDKGKVLCRKCRKEVTDSAARWREKHPKKQAEYSERSRQKRIMDGRCSQCCQEKAKPGYRYGPKCLASQSPLRASGQKPRAITCSICDGKLPPERHDKRNCPLELEIQKAEIASSRPGVW